MERDANWTRRDFLGQSGAAAGVVGLGAATGSAWWSGPAAAGPSAAAGWPVHSAIPSQHTMFSWIRWIYSWGIRRPGYLADVIAANWIAAMFRLFGLENVRKEPITVQRWKPGPSSLRVTTQSGTARDIACFPVPYAASVDRLDLELAAFDRAAPGKVTGKASLYETPLLRLPADLFLSGSTPERVIDPEGTMPAATHVLPFGADLTLVMEPSIEAGAAAFVGALTDHPGDTHQYYVPYDAQHRPIPGVWVSGSDGAWLRSQLAAGWVRLRLSTPTRTDEVRSYNVVGELPGADDDMVIIGSHHDGPWRSAVEDASGMALVLAQARYWASRSVHERPHRMVFLLQGGHMSGGAGLHTFIEEHRHELDRVVLELHLEHAARDITEENGELVPTGTNVPRWFFTSEAPELEEAVRTALVEENLTWSLILPPEALGPQPPTDGGYYHNAGVPIVNFLAAPFYLFDPIDTPDKVDKENLVPLTRAAVRVLESTRGVSADEMRRRITPSVSGLSLASV